MAEELNPKHRKQIADLKRPVMDAARNFSVVREKLATLAPKVVGIFAAINADNPRFTFVEFCRQFDESIPTHAADRDGEQGYRNHKTYYTLAYMRRMVQLGGERQRSAGQGVRNNATDGLARTLATLLQIVDNPDAVYNAIQKEFGMGERIMTRLRKRVEDTKPLFKLAVAKPLKVGNVLHMAPPQPQADDRGEMGQPGRTVALPAPSEGGRAKTAAKRSRAA